MDKLAIPHRWRLWAIALLALFDIAALVALHFGVAAELIGATRPLIDTALLAVLAVLAPALGDAYLVERRRRMRGVPALPDDNVLEEARQDAARSLRETRRGDSALGVLLVAVVASTLTACGAAPVVTNSQIGAAATDAARETRAIVRAYRTDSMRAAARAAFEAEGEARAALEEEARRTGRSLEELLVEAAIAAAIERGEELAPLVEAQRAYALAAHGYVEAARAADGADDPETLLAAARDVLDTYRLLRRIGASLGVAELAGLPPVPAWLDGLLPPQLTTPRAQEGEADE